MYVPLIPPARLAAMRRGERWWPAEIVARGAGAALLAGAARLLMVARRMAITPAPHAARLPDLAVCAGAIMLLCAGLMLVIEGAGLLRDVSLPGHFPRKRTPGTKLRQRPPGRA